jgi:chromate transporter
MIAELFWRFALVGLLAFGGGQAALPLVERVAVSEMGAVTPQDFATAVALGYLTPGPVLITATFIGYTAAGIGGAVAATLGAFLMPWALAAAAAQALQRLMRHRWLAGFGRGAAPAVVGLLGVTALSLGESAFASWPFAVIAIVALLLAWRTKVHPIAIIVGGGLCGAGLGVLSWP